MTPRVQSPDASSTVGRRFIDRFENFSVGGCTSRTTDQTIALGLTDADPPRSRRSGTVGLHAPCSATHGVRMRRPLTLAKSFRRPSSGVGCTRTRRGLVSELALTEAVQPSSDTSDASISFAAISPESGHVLGVVGRTTSTGHEMVGAAARRPSAVTADAAAPPACDPGKEFCGGRTRNQAGEFVRQVLLQGLTLLLRPLLERTVDVVGRPPAAYPRAGADAHQACAMAATWR